MPPSQEGPAREGCLEALGRAAPQWEVGWNMFESILANFLTTRAAQFIKHIPQEQLRVGVWRGEIVLDDLELRSDCLDGLGLPLTLEAGYVGNLRISIPWSYLGTKPVVAEIDRIHLVLRLQENLRASSQDAAATAAEMSKQAAIMAAELAKRSNGSSSSPGWLTSMLMNKIINSFQMRVRDLHVRIEADPAVSGGPSIAIGLVCQAMRSHSSRTVSGEQKLEVTGLSLYWDRNVKMTCVQSDTTLHEIAALFETWGGADDKAESLPSVHEDEDGDIFYVAPSDDGGSFSQQHHFILEPCNVDVSLILSPHKSVSKLLISIQSIPVMLEVGQIWDIFRLLDWMEVVGIRRELVHIRPEVCVTDDRRAWWRYAIQATLHHLDKSRWRLRWSQVRVHLGQRREYASLYRMVLNSKASAEDRHQLSFLESQLPVDAIMFARGLAELHEVARTSSSASSSMGGPQGGWFRWGLRWMAQTHRRAPPATGTPSPHQHSPNQPALSASSGPDAFHQPVVVDGHGAGERGVEEAGDLDVALTAEQEDFLLQLTHPVSASPLASQAMSSPEPLSHSGQHASTSNLESDAHLQRPSLSPVKPRSPLREPVLENGLDGDTCAAQQLDATSVQGQFASPTPHRPALGDEDAATRAAENAPPTTDVGTPVASPASFDKEDVGHRAADSAASSSMSPPQNVSSINSTNHATSRQVDRRARERGREGRRSSCARDDVPADDSTHGLDALSCVSSESHAAAPGSADSGQASVAKHDYRALALACFGVRTQAELTHSSARVQFRVGEVRLTFSVLIAADEDPVTSPELFQHGRWSEVLDSDERDHGDGAGGAYLGLQPIITAMLTGIHFDSFSPDGGLEMDVTVQTIQVRDLMTARTKYPWLLQSQPQQLLPASPGTGHWYMPADDLEDSSEGAGEAALKVVVRVTPARDCFPHSGSSPSASTHVSVTINPLEATLAPDSLEALSAYFVPEFEYPFHEHLVLDALNGLTQGQGLIAAKLAYLVQRSGSGITLDINANQVRLVLPLKVTAAEGPGVIITAKKVKVSMLPYGCLKCSHASICKRARAAVEASTPAQRRALLQQMFMVPWDISVEDVEVFAASMLTAPQPRHSNREEGDKNAQPTLLGRSLVEPVSLDVHLELSQIRADASLPLCFVQVKMPSLHCHMHAEELADLALTMLQHSTAESGGKAPYSCYASKGAKNGTTARGLGSNQGLKAALALQSLRAQTGRTIGGATPSSAACSYAASRRLSDASLLDLDKDKRVLGEGSFMLGSLANFGQNFASPACGTNADAAPRGVLSEDWLHSSLDAALNLSGTASDPGRSSDHTGGKESAPTLSSSEIIVTGKQQQRRQHQSLLPRSSADDAKQSDPTSHSSPPVLPSRIKDVGHASLTGNNVQTEKGVFGNFQETGIRLSLNVDDTDAPIAAPESEPNTQSGAAQALGHESSERRPDWKNVNGVDEDPAAAVGNVSSAQEAMPTSRDACEGEDAEHSVGTTPRSRWWNKMLVWRSGRAIQSRVLPSTDRENDGNGNGVTRPAHSETPAEPNSRVVAGKGVPGAWSWLKAKVTRSKRADGESAMDTVRDPALQRALFGAPANLAEASEHPAGSGDVALHAVDKSATRAQCLVADAEEMASERNSTTASTSAMLSTLSTAQSQPMGRATRMELVRPESSRILTPVAPSLPAPSHPRPTVTSAAPTQGGELSTREGPKEGWERSLREFAVGRSLNSLNTLGNAIHSLNSLGTAVSSSLFKPPSAADRHEALEMEAKHKVLMHPSAARLAAFTAATTRGLSWPELSWRQRLDACTTHQFDVPLRRLQSSNPFDGGIDPDSFPRLRERHAASFLLLDQPLSECHARPSSDTVHLELELKISTVSFMLMSSPTSTESPGLKRAPGALGVWRERDARDRLAAGWDHHHPALSRDQSGPVPESCLAACLRLLAPHADTLEHDDAAGGVEEAPCVVIGYVARRYGMDLSASVGGVDVHVGDDEKVSKRDAESLVLTSEPQRILHMLHQRAPAVALHGIAGFTRVVDQRAGMMANKPARNLLTGHVSIYEPGHAPPDRACTGVYLHVDRVAAQVDLDIARQVIDRGITLWVLLAPLLSAMAIHQTHQDAAAVHATPTLGWDMAYGSVADGAGSCSSLSPNEAAGLHTLGGMKAFETKLNQLQLDLDLGFVFATVGSFSSISQTSGPQPERTPIFKDKFRGWCGGLTIGWNRIHVADGEVFGVVKLDDVQCQAVSARDGDVLQILGRNSEECLPTGLAHSYGADVASRTEKDTQDEANRASLAPILSWKVCQRGGERRDMVVSASATKPSTHGCSSQNGSEEQPEYLTQVFMAACTEAEDYGDQAGADITSHEVASVVVPTVAADVVSDPTLKTSDKSGLLNAERAHFEATSLDKGEEDNKVEEQQSSFQVTFAVQALKVEVSPAIVEAWLGLHTYLCSLRQPVSSSPERRPALESIEASNAAHFATRSCTLPTAAPARPTAPMSSLVGPLIQFLDRVDVHMELGRVWVGVCLPVLPSDAVADARSDFSESTDNNTVPMSMTILDLDGIDFSLDQPSGRKTLACQPNVDFAQRASFGAEQDRRREPADTTQDTKGIRAGGGRSSTLDMPASPDAMLVTKRARFKVHGIRLQTMTAAKGKRDCRSRQHASAAAYTTIVDKFDLVVEGQCERSRSTTMGSEGDCNSCATAGVAPGVRANDIGVAAASSAVDFGDHRADDLAVDPRAACISARVSISLVSVLLDEESLQTVSQMLCSISTLAPIAHRAQATRKQGCTQTNGHSINSEERVLVFDDGMFALLADRIDLNFDAEGVDFTWKLGSENKFCQLSVLLLQLHVSSLLRTCLTRSHQPSPIPPMVAVGEGGGRSGSGQGAQSLEDGEGGKQVRPSARQDQRSLTAQKVTFSDVVNMCSADLVLQTLSVHAGVSGETPSRVAVLAGGMSLLQSYASQRRKQLSSHENPLHTSGLKESDCDGSVDSVFMVEARWYSGAVQTNSNIISSSLHTATSSSAARTRDADIKVYLGNLLLQHDHEAIRSVEQMLREWCGAATWIRSASEPASGAETLSRFSLSSSSGPTCPPSASRQTPQPGLSANHSLPAAPGVVAGPASELMRLFLGDVDQGKVSLSVKSAPLTLFLSGESDSPQQCVEVVASINLSGVARQGNVLTSVIVSKSPNVGQIATCTAFDSAPVMTQALEVVAQLRHLSISTGHRNTSSQTNADSQLDYRVLEVGDIEARVHAQSSVQSEVDEAVANVLETDVMQQGNVVLGSMGAHPMGVGAVCTRTHPVHSFTGAMSPGTGISIDADRAGAMQIEVNVRCRAGVLVRLSSADLTRIMSIALGAATSLGDMASPLLREAKTQTPHVEKKAVTTLLAQGASHVSKWAFKADGVRIVCLECRQGGRPTDMIRLPLLSCQVEGVELLVNEQVSAADAQVGRHIPSLSRTSSLRFHASMHVSYFNRWLAVWEPMLERCSLGLEMSLDRSLHDIFVRGVSEALPKQVGIRITAKDVVNINLSTALVDVVAAAVTHSSTAFRTRSTPALSQKEHGHNIVTAFHPLWVCNELGHPIVIQCGQTQQRLTTTSDKVPVTCVPLVQSGGVADGLPMLAASSLHLFLPPAGDSSMSDAADGYTRNDVRAGADVTVDMKTSCKVRLDVIGRQMMTLQVPVVISQRVVGTRGVRIVVDVVVEEGGASKLIHMRSPLMITNKLSTPLELMFADNSADVDGPTMAGRQRRLLAPAASMMVPVLYMDNKQGFSLRPLPQAEAAAGYGNKHPGYRWATGESLMWREWRAQKELKHFKAMGVHGLPFSAVLHWDTDSGAQDLTVARRLSTVCRLSVHPALTIENLLPCTLSVRIISTMHSDPPSPRGAGRDVDAGALWSIDLSSGESQEIHDRDMSPGTYMWLSVKVPDLSWSSALLVRDGSISLEADQQARADEALEGGSIGWLESIQPDVKARRPKLLLRGPRKRVLELEVEVRVQECGTCSVHVYAAYWIINRTHEQAFVRVAPDVAVAPNDSLESLVAVPALPLKGVEDRLVSVLALGGDDGTPAQTLRNGGGLPGLTQSLGTDPNSAVPSQDATGGMPLSQAPVPSTKGLAFLADLDLDDDDDVEASAAFAQPANAGGICAGRPAAVAVDDELSSQLHLENGAHVKLFSLVSTQEDEVKTGWRMQSGVQIRLGSSSWSEMIAVTGSSSVDTGIVKLRHGSGYGGRHSSDRLGGRLNRELQLGVAIQSARGRFHRTKTITLTPRYVLVNQLPFPIEVRQEGSAYSLVISPSSSLATAPPGGTEPEDMNQVVWHWSELGKRHNLQLALCSEELNPSLAMAAHENERWSGSVDLDKLGDSVLIVPAQESAHGRLMRRDKGLLYVDVRVRRCLGCISVLIRASSSNQPPYCIQNLSPYTLRLYQRDQLSNRHVYLRAYQSMPYAWETVLPDSSKHALLIQVEGSSPLLTGSFQLDRVGDHAPIVRDSSPILYASVRCDGPTLTLTLTDAQLHPRLITEQLTASLPRLHLNQPQSLLPQHHLQTKLGMRRRYGSEADLEDSSGSRRIKAVSSLSDVSNLIGSDVKGAHSDLTAPPAKTWFGEIDIKVLAIGLSLVDSQQQHELVYLWLGADPSEAFNDTREGLHAGQAGMPTFAEPSALLSDATGLAGLSLSLWRTRQEDGMVLSIPSLQVDNLTPDAPCPVVLSRSRFSALQPSTQSHHTLTLKLARNTFAGSSIEVLSLVDLECEPLDAALDAALLVQLKTWFDTVMSRNVRKALLPWLALHAQDLNGPPSLCGEDALLRKTVKGEGRDSWRAYNIYLHKARISTLTINLSYSPTVAALEFSSLHSLEVRLRFARVCINVGLSISCVGYMCCTTLPLYLSAELMSLFACTICCRGLILT